MTNEAINTCIIISVTNMMKGKVMKSTIQKKDNSKLHFVILVSISALFLIINMTGCTLSRQFLRTHTGHGYGPSYSNTTMSSEWDFIENSGSVNQWDFDDYTSNNQDSECRVGFSTGEVTGKDIEMNHIQMTHYPTPLYPRGIYTTGTGIIIVVDLYK